MDSFLFNDFDPITTAAWKQKIQVDLNGLDYNESLIWKSNDGIAVKPFYTKEDRHLSKISLPDVGYNICQTIFVDNIEIANKLALDSIERDPRSSHGSSATATSTPSGSSRSTRCSTTTGC